MSIEAIGASTLASAGTSATQASAPLNAALPAADPAKAGLYEAVLQGITNVNQGMQQTQKVVEGMALGETDNLHQVMMSLEHTRLQFELLMQVRNRVLEAYQELMRMQV